MLHIPALSLLAPVVMVLSAGSAALFSTQGAVALAMSWAATVALAFLLRPRYLLGIIVGVTTALGAGTQARLAGNSMDEARAPLAMVLVGVLLGLVLARMLIMGRWSTRRVGMALVVSAILLRWLSVVKGSSASGAINLLGSSLHVGELVRVLFVVGLAGLLYGNEQITGAWWRRSVKPSDVMRWSAVVALPTGFIVLSLIFLDDHGPAVIVALASAAMLYRAVGVRLAVVPLLAVAVTGVLVGGQSAELEERLQDMSDPFGHGADQLGRAVRAIGLTGWIGRGSGSSAMAETIPARTSDYLPAVVGADLGLIVLLVAIALLLGLSLSLLIGARTVTGTAGLLATGMAVLLFVPTLWTGLGNLALLPLSGIDVPFLSANGTSTLAYAATLGAATGALRWGEPAVSVGALKSPSGHVLAAAAFMSVAALVSATGKGGFLAWTGGERLAQETLYRARGELRTVDGHVIAAASSPNGPRVYDERYLSLGWLAPRSSQVGMEFLGAGALTCGTHRGRVSLLLHLGFAEECSPRTTITSVSNSLQTVLAQEVNGIQGATVVALDAKTGGVLGAAASSPTPAESTISAKVGTMDFTEAAESGTRLPAFLERAPFTEAITPGSVFKLVTGTAAAASDLQAPVLGDNYTPNGGTPIANAWEGPCPDTTLRSMLAHSCNTTAGWYAAELGIQRLTAASRALGYPGPTMVGPVDPTSGIMSTWPATGSTLGEPTNDAEIARTGFGQEGVRSTPFGVAYSTAVIASRGQIASTTMIAGTCDGEDFEPWHVPSADALEARAEGMGIDAESLSRALDRVADGMEAAVSEGTATALRDVLPGHAVAAKTGTAEVEGRAVVSWITVVVDDRLVLTVAVQPTPDRPRPPEGARAIDIAARVIPYLKAGDASSACIDS